MSKDHHFPGLATIAFGNLSVSHKARVKNLLFLHIKINFPRNFLENSEFLYKKRNFHPAAPAHNLPSGDLSVFGRFQRTRPVIVKGNCRIGTGQRPESYSGIEDSPGQSKPVPGKRKGHL
jgi:hypothetical protein